MAPLFAGNFEVLQPHASDPFMIGLMLHAGISTQVGTKEKELTGFGQGC
jgi:hypothetical protein